MSNSVFSKVLELHGAKLEPSKNRTIVRYPKGEKDTIHYLIRLQFDNPEFQFVEETALQFIN